MNVHPPAILSINTVPTATIVVIGILNFLPGDNSPGKWPYSKIYLMSYLPHWLTINDIYILVKVATVIYPAGSSFIKKKLKKAFQPVGGPISQQTTKYFLKMQVSLVSLQSNSFLARSAIVFQPLYINVVLIGTYIWELSLGNSPLGLWLSEATLPNAICTWTLPQNKH